MRFIRLTDYAWWLWLAIACCLLAGLLTNPAYFLVAIGISTIQALVFVGREHSLMSFPAQLRIAYLVLV